MDGDSKCQVPSCICLYIDKIDKFDAIQGYRYRVWNAFISDHRGGATNFGSIVVFYLSCQQISKLAI